MEPCRLSWRRSSSAPSRRQLVRASRHGDGGASGTPWGLCDRCVRGHVRAGARAGRHRHGPDTFDQAALTSIILGIAARGAGTRTSSMPFADVASTWAASTPSGRVTLRSNAPYATSRTK
jgi:hypothetical protein